VIVGALACLALSTSACKSDSGFASRPRNDKATASSASGFSSTENSPAPSAATPTARDEVHADVRFLVNFRGGADERAPLVIGIHGRGDTPENFSRVFRDFTARAELAWPQAPDRFSDGWSWFPGSRSTTPSEFAATLDAAEKRLWPAILDIARGRRVFVTGFSQGGMLSYVLAARHPREIAYAFPISGGAPRALLPRDRAPAAPIYALHGARDDLIEVDMARSTVAAFKEEGATVVLREFAGVGHTITGEMRGDLLDHLRAAIDAESARSLPSSSAAEQGRSGRPSGVKEGDAAPKSL
jgi:phospholipase/carboxylesterase